VRCGSCGSEVPDGSKFCPSCGHALESRGDERRVVTVVFADIVGFTSLAETADPEHVKELVDRCFERLAAEVTAFGGKVDKIIGDAMVALFGAPVAHEDDAERAVRAALRMLDTVASQHAGDDVAVQLRIGVNTGEVFVGALRAGGEYTAMGDVVNTAQRLQSLADPGSVVVGQATRAATGDAIAYRDLGPVEVRGRDEPVFAAVAVEALLPPGRQRRTGGVLVGRDAELALLERMVELAVARGRAQLLLLVGEAGQGKSRLAAELADRIACQHGATVLEGRCVPYGEANPYWPVAEALRHAWDLRGQATPDEAAATARSAVADVLELADDDAEVGRVVAGLLHLMGYEVEARSMDPQRGRDEATWAVVRYLEAASERGPLVLSLSDLHWADPDALTLVAGVLDRLGRCPFILLATSRTLLGEQLVGPGSRHNELVVHVDPLERDAAARLLDDLVDGPLASELREELLDRAGGNPLFLEELVALLAAAEPGVTQAGVAPPAPTLSAPGATAASLAGVPDTLRGLVAARLDGLSESARQVVQDAAVWGHGGKFVVLEEMGVGHGTTDLGMAMAELVDREVLVVDRDRWAFRSELIREVAYGMLTKSERARRHGGIALFLDAGQSNPSTATDRTVDVVAHHYSAAAQLAAELGEVPGIPANAPSRALTWLEEAASRAGRGLEHRVARVTSTQALDLLDRVGLGADEHAARRCRLLLLRARAEASLRELDAARDDVDEAADLAAQAGDAAVGAEVLITRGELEQKSGFLAASEQTLLRAAEEYRAIGDESGEADALLQLGLTRLFLGDDGGAESSLSAALAGYREHGNRHGEAWALQHLAWISFSGTRPDEAEQRIRESAATFADLGDQGGLVWADGMLAFVRFQQGDLAGAKELGMRVERDARLRGDRWGVAMMQALQAGIALWSGRTAAAVRQAEAARDLFRELADPFGETQAAVALGRALVILGDVEAGLAVLTDTVETVGPASDLAGVRAMAATALAAALVHAGEPERAAAAVDEPRDPDARHAVGEVERLAALALVEAQSGDPARAVAMVSDARPAPGGEPSPYLLAVAALAGAAARTPVADIEALATKVRAGPAGSYLDRFMADLALALARCGAAGADEVAGVDALADDLAVTEDRVTAAVLALARGEVRRLLGLPGAEPLLEQAERQWAELGLDGHGWLQLLGRALAAGRHPVEPAL
jgi:class 3 adenylate cyclase/tetratricopeptide (TPR) repeat protein